MSLSFINSIFRRNRNKWLTMKNKFNNISERSFICATKPINPRLRYMQKLLFQIFLIVCFMVFLTRYVNEHEKIYEIANIVFYGLFHSYISAIINKYVYSINIFCVVCTKFQLCKWKCNWWVNFFMCHDLFQHEM